MLACVACPARRGQVIWIIRPTTFEWNDVIYFVSHATTVGARPTIAIEDRDAQLLPPSIALTFLGHRLPHHKRTFAYRSKGMGTQDM
jgi:hypothetical protein